VGVGTVGELPGAAQGTISQLAVTVELACVSALRKPPQTRIPALPGSSVAVCFERSSSREVDCKKPLWLGSYSSVTVVAPSVPPVTWTFPVERSVAV
jgi:hypothetical protein